LKALGIVAGGLLVGAAGNAPAQPRDTELGRRVYVANCAVCHGERGDGRGDAAHHFRAAPRDFTAGRYKIRSTASGQLPTDEDLRRSIVRGLPGTGMVPQDHLGETEIDAVIAFIQSLSPRFAAGPAPAPLPIPPPPGSTPTAIAHGRQVYEKAECHECHGRGGRGDGPSAKDLKVKPADLTRRPFKNGPTAQDIVRSLITGLDGTPMPSYHLILDDAELWDLAYYVESIGSPPDMTEDERAGWHVVRTHQKRPR
jgi:cytochrome c oxidase cbb3-type subunit 2